MLWMDQIVTNSNDSGCATMRLKVWLGLGIGIYFSIIWVIGTAIDITNEKNITKSNSKQSVQRFQVLRQNASSVLAQHDTCV